VRLDEAERQRTDVRNCLDDAIALLKPRVGSRIQFKTDYGDIPTILAYPASLGQVFFDLLLNSMEAIEGKGTITVSTTSDDEYVQIAICDTGRGIPKQMSDRVFDPGFTTKGVSVGVGLGLPICFQIIQSQGGDIRVDSTEGQGTTVTVRLRVDDGAGQDEL
jgi:signal transduction histidine kinase